ncbi:MAG: hypothetical protein ABJL99_21055 [Aliishimia sp.]
MTKVYNDPENGLKLIIRLLDDLHDSGYPPQYIQAEDGILVINSYEFSPQQSIYLVENSEPLQGWLAETKPECLLM